MGNWEGKKTYHAFFIVIGKNYYSIVLFNTETFFFQLSSISLITMKSFIYLRERNIQSSADLEVMSSYINIIRVTLWQRSSFLCPLV